MKYFPEVVQAIPRPGYRVLVFFVDGKIVEKDMSGELHGPAFAPLQDEAVFKRACRVMNATVAWDIEGTNDPSRVVDIDPLELYRLPSQNAKWANYEGPF